MKTILLLIAFHLGAPFPLDKSDSIKSDFSVKTYSTKNDSVGQDDITADLSKREISDVGSINFDSISLDSISLDSVKFDDEGRGTKRALLLYFPGYLNHPCSQDVYGNCGRKNVTAPKRGYNKKALLAEIRKKMKLEQEKLLNAQTSTTTRPGN